MGDFRVSQLWPVYVQSVGRMRDSNVAVAAICSKCRRRFKVDLDAIIKLRGRSYSLIDQRGQCRIFECDGTAFFVWSPAANTPFRPLTSEASDMARAAGKAEDDPPEAGPPPPQPPAPAPRGVRREAWASASERERKVLIRRARG